MAGKSETETFADIFARFGRELKLPGMDVDSILAHHRRNFEALERSARVLVEGGSSVASRQHELMKRTLEQVAENARSFQPTLDPSDAFRRQTDLARKTFEAAIENVEDLSEILSKSGSESFSILRRRMEAAIQEIHGGRDK